MPICIIYLARVSESQVGQARQAGMQSSKPLLLPCKKKLPYGMQLDPVGLQIGGCPRSFESTGSQKMARLYWSDSVHSSVRGQSKGSEKKSHSQPVCDLLCGGPHDRRPAGQGSRNFPTHSLGLPTCNESRTRRQPDWPQASGPCSPSGAAPRGQKNRL